MLPKVCEAREVMAVAERTGLCVWPMLETARGVLCAREIAEAAARSGPAALVLGTNDLSAELGLEAGNSRSALTLAMQTAVLAAKAAGIDLLDGVSNALTDTAAVEREAREARALGMTGKTVIHPAQIDPVNRAFSPTTEEIDRARAVVAAMAEATSNGRSVATLNGKLIERLHADTAEQILAHAEAIAAPYRA
ncbi:MAG: aldolase/citrate lyase family protein [Pseudomonadota bacterium]